MEAPKVETLAQSMAMLDPGYQEQRGLINEQMEGLGAKYQADRQALEGTRVQSFDAIRGAANAMGVAFGGFSMDEQAQYLANEYLPGLQRVDQQERDERMSLRTQVADLNLQQNTLAVGRIDQQTQALNNWNLQQAQMEAQRREAEIQRQFQAEQSRLDRDFQASQNAADRANSLAAASIGSGGSAAPQVSAHTQVTEYLNQFVNPDTGRVPKSIWASAIKRAEEGGMKWSGSGGFADTFWNYRPQ